MSGPIVRKYGFPNFEQIFGSREIQHGKPDEPPAQSDQDSEDQPESPATGSPPGKDATREEQQSEDSAQL